MVTASVRELKRRLGVGDSCGELPDMPGVWGLPGPEETLVLVADTAAEARWTRQRRHVLSPAEAQRAARFVLPGLGDTWAATRVLLREVLGRATLVPAPNVRIHTGQFGKPRIEGVEFSLSHTRSAVLIGLGVVPLGVDMERIVGSDVVRQIGPALHPMESVELLRLAMDKRPEAFTQLWVRKESMLKALGTGLFRDISRDYVGTGTTPGAAMAGVTIYDLDLPDSGSYRAALSTSIRYEIAPESIELG